VTASTYTCIICMYELLTVIKMKCLGRYQVNRRRSFCVFQRYFWI